MMLICFTTGGDRVSGKRLYTNNILDVISARRKNETGKGRESERMTDLSSGCLSWRVKGKRKVTFGERPG